MIDRLEPGLMTVSRQYPESENTGDPSPFMTVFVARSVVRKFWISVLFLVLAVILVVLIVVTLVNLDQSYNLGDDHVEIPESQAFFTIPVLGLWTAAFFILFIGFLVSAIQNYRGSFKDFSDLMAHFRLSKKDKDKGDVIACPKCGNEIRMIGEISNGECKSCGFEVYPKSAGRKVAKASENFTALGLPELLITGRELLHSKEYVQAFHVFKNVTVRFPDNHEGWWGMLCAKTEMFGRLPVSPTFRSWYSKAYSLAPSNTQATYKSTFEAWSDARSAAEQ